MPSEKILNQKKELVDILAEKFKKAKMVVLTEYRGISVLDDTILRSKVRSENNEYMVTKNSIILHAAKQAGIDGLDGKLEGPTAVVISYDDYIAPARAINDYSKGHDFYKVKMGIMDNVVIDDKKVIKLATLPSKDTLYSMVASALIGNIRNFAVVVDQVRKQKECV
ncbi:MAG: 50S ribosomal protein L10 [Clostridia bacterium]